MKKKKKKMKHIFFCSSRTGTHIHKYVYIQFSFVHSYTALFARRTRKDLCGGSFITSIFVLILYPVHHPSSLETRRCRKKSFGFQRATKAAILFFNPLFFLVTYIYLYALCQVLQIFLSCSPPYTTRFFLWLGL